MELQHWCFKLLSISSKKSDPKMVKNQINPYKKGIVTKYRKSKAFQDSKKQFSSFQPPWELVRDTAADLETIPCDQNLTVQEVMQKKHKDNWNRKYCTESMFLKGLKSSNCSEVLTFVVLVWYQFIHMKQE